MTDLPELKLRNGLRKTNISIHRDGKTFTEAVEPGKTYKGEEYHQSVPSILTPVDPEVKAESLKRPEPAPHRRGARRLRRTLTPDKVATTPSVKVKAILKKKHVEKKEEVPATKAAPPAKAPPPKAAPAKKAPAKKAPPKKKAPAKKTRGRSR